MSRRTIIFLLPVYAAIIGYLVFYGITKFSADRKWRVEYSWTETATGNSNTDNVSQGKPVKLLLPELKLTLNIEEGNYSETTKSWNVSKTNAHWANVTALANNKSGNTLIYGHNTNNVLGSTRNLKIGDKLILVTDNNLSFEYTLTGFKEVGPQDTEIFSYQGNPILTLVTCTGIADKKRKLMNFD